MLLLDLAARALAQSRPRLSALRFSSSLRGDQEHLHDILGQADDARSTSPPPVYPLSLTPRSLRRPGAPLADNRPPQKIRSRPGTHSVFPPHTRSQPAKFIRPHYWSHKHRFQPRNGRTAPPLVAPGRKEAFQYDIFREFGIDPLWETSNSTLLATFVSELGKIRPRTQTRLTTKTQRKLAKAIRRAKMMGVIPLFYNPRMMPKPGHLS